MNDQEKTPAAHIGEVIMNLQAAFHPIGEVVKKMQVALQPIGELAKQLQINATRFVVANPDFFQNLQRIAEDLKNLPERQRDAWSAAAQSGWYINWHSSIVIPRTTLDDQSALDAFMIDHLQSDWDLITQSIRAVCPERAEILDCAFSLHLEKRYIASIPLFLAQADGICEQYLGAFLFAEKGKRIQKIMELQQEQDELINILLHVLGLDTQFSARISKDSDELKSLAPNRNGILHGARNHVDYGTEINSYKAFSLLAFVAFVLADREAKPASEQIIKPL